MHHSPDEAESRAMLKFKLVRLAEVDLPDGTLVSFRVPLKRLSLALRLYGGR